MKNPSVAIIILNWNGYIDTIECVKSLKKLNYPNYKIIMVDNGSTNDSVKELRSKFPEIKLIENKRNLGFSGGCNVGIKYALREKSEYILLLNNDTLVEKDLLSTLVKAITTYPNAGIVAPLIYYQNKPNIIFSSGGFKSYKSPYPFKDPCFNLSKKHAPKEIAERDCVTGCCILISKDLIKKIGYLDDRYFLYAEDTDYCIRAREAGFKVLIDPSSKIFHAVSGSSGGEGNKRKEYYDNRNLILLCNKYVSKNERFTFLYNFLKGRLYDILVYIRAGKYAHAQAIFTGIAHGFLGRTGQNTNQ